MIQLILHTHLLHRNHKNAFKKYIVVLMQCSISFTVNIFLMLSDSN